MHRGAAVCFRAYSRLTMRQRFGLLYEAIASDLEVRVCDQDTPLREFSVCNAVLNQLLLSGSADHITSMVTPIVWPANSPG